MRAILLAAGLGIRLRPLTNTIQKNMIPLGGKPILEYLIRLLKKHGINEIVINLYYLGEQIENYFGNGEKFGVKIRYLREKELSGTATPIRKIEETYPGFCSEGTFLVVYADHLTDIDISKVIRFHEEKKPIATLTIHAYSDPWAKGIVSIDQNNKVLGFIEKPSKEEILSGKYKGEPASLAYVFEPEILKYLRNKKEDLGADVFPRMLKEGCTMYAINPQAYVCDIGTPKKYEQAKKDFTKSPERFIFYSYEN